MPKDLKPKYDVRIQMTPELAMWMKGSYITALYALLNVLTTEYSFFQRYGGLGKNNANITAALRSKLSVLQDEGELYKCEISIQELPMVGEEQPFTLMAEFQLFATLLEMKNPPRIWIGSQEEMIKLDSARRPAMIVNKKAERVKTLGDRIKDIGRTDGYTPNATEIQDMLKAEIKELRHLLHNPISRLSVRSDSDFAANFD